MKRLALLLLVPLLWAPVAEAKPKLSVERAKGAIARQGRADIGYGSVRVHSCKRWSRTQVNCWLWQRQGIEWQEDLAIARMGHRVRVCFAAEDDEACGSY